MPDQRSKSVVGTARSDCSGEEPAYRTFIPAFALNE
jgi:hypothetical protein